MTDMNATSDLEVVLASWLADDGTTDIRPDVVDSAIQSSLRLRPRRGAAAWVAGVRPWPKGRRVGVPSARSVLAIALITALLLALAAVAAAPRRPSLLGEIEPTGPMAVAVWHPVTEVLADGSVLVVGPVQLGVEQLRAERWDPRTGRFTPVEGVPRTRARPGTFGSVRLPDGGALLIVKRIEGGRWTEASGGFAVRFDPATGRFRPAGTFSSGAVPASASEFAFGDWPATVEPDGTVSWTPVGRDFGEPTITYDPGTDTFATEETAAAPPAQPFEDWPIIVLADGRRTLSLHWTEERTEGTVYDAAGAVAATFRWPLVHGGAYDGILLPDGRVLLVGDSIAIVDPDTGAFDPVELPVRLAIRGRWLDGRILLEDPLSNSYETAGSAGHGGDSRPWIFDPATDRFAILSDGLVPRSATWTVLDDGRVLIVSEDDGSDGAIAPRAVLLR